MERGSGKGAAIRNAAKYASLPAKWVFRTGFRPNASNSHISSRGGMPWRFTGRAESTTITNPSGFRPWRKFQRNSYGCVTSWYM